MADIYSPCQGIASYWRCQIYHDVVEYIMALSTSSYGFAEYLLSCQEYIWRCRASNDVVEYIMTLSTSSYDFAGYPIVLPTIVWPDIHGVNKAATLYL